MNGNISHDDILFDRLVDGELSLAERRALVRSLDARSDGWRKCALAFLESQSWQNDVCAMTATPSSSIASSDAKKFAAPTLPEKRISMRTVAPWFAVAAGLLIAFRMGNLQRGGTTNPVVNVPVPVNSQMASVHSLPQAAAPTAAKPGDALNLWVRDDSGQVRRVRVPLVDASALDPALGLQFQTGVSDDVRNRLQNQGLTVQSKRRYAPMWLDNGRPMIVPVEDTKIVPVSNRAY
jgi:hypothetical protein